MPLEEHAPSDSTILYSKTELSLMEQGYQFVSLFQTKAPDILFSVALLISHQFSVTDRVSFHAERHGDFIRILARHERPSILPPTDSDDTSPEEALPLVLHPGTIIGSSSMPPPLPASKEDTEEFDDGERPTRVDSPSVRVTEPGRMEIPAVGTGTEIEPPPESGFPVDDGELIHH